MTQAALYFDLDIPEDRKAFERVTKADQVSWLLSDLDQYIREGIKDPEATAERITTLQRVQTHLHESLSERELYGAVFEE